MIKGCILRSARLPRGVVIAALAFAACAPGLANAAASLGSQRPQPSKPLDAPAGPTPTPPDADPTPRGSVTRARMLECGHQWNNMKHAGTASGTWKDFSRGCLAQR